MQQNNRSDINDNQAKIDAKKRKLTPSISSSSTRRRTPQSRRQSRLAR